MKKYFQAMRAEQSGITLVALVVSIIVLLILAGVSINAMVGNNGIITQAQNAVLKNRAAIAKEEIETAFVAVQASYYTNKSSLLGTAMPTATGGVYYSENNVVYYYSPEQGAFKTTIGDYNLGEVVEITADAYPDSDEGRTQLATDLLIAKQTYEATHPEKHTPEGFQYLEGSLLEGYVITDDTDLTDSTPGNEFVWIPVPDSTKYEKKMGTRNWSLSASGEQHGTNAPTIAAGISGDDLGYTSTTVLGISLGDNADRPEAPLVNNAGGFWVGRYEAGYTSAAHSNENSGDSRFTAGNTIEVKAGKEPFRYVYQNTCLTKANEWRPEVAADVANESKIAFQSGLITGAEWDTMCKFIGWDICDSDCTNWGNYYNIGSSSYSGLRSESNNGTWSELATKTANSYSMFPTGTFVNSYGYNTAKKNIYDVAGNVWEWTTEIPTYTSGHAVIRGGSAGAYGYSYLASYRNGNHSATTHAHWHIGFRLVLYVQ